MTQDQFRTECLEAIKPYHDPKADGALLVGTRTNCVPSVLQPGTDIEYTEYAAELGCWPTVESAKYWELPKEAVDYLVSTLQARRPAIEQEEPEPMEPHPLDYLLD
jgi:hypothetical protein